MLKMMARNYLRMINLLSAKHVFNDDIRMMISFSFDGSFSILDGALGAPVDAGETHLTVPAPLDGSAVHSNIIFRAYPFANAALVAGISYPEFLRYFEDDPMTQHVAPSFEVLF